MKSKNDMDTLQLTAFYNNFYLLEIKQPNKKNPIAICLCRKCHKYNMIPVAKINNAKCQYCNNIATSEISEWQKQVKQEQQSKMQEYKEQYQYSLNQQKIQNIEDMERKRRELQEKLQIHILYEDKENNRKLTKKQKEYLKNVQNKKQGSKGERKIAFILDNAGINYQREKTFPDFKYEDTCFSPRFDFYVNDKYIIEYDGEQHFQEIKYYNSSLEKNQEHDKIKNNYCFANNIPIIRIPYTHYNNLCLEDLLLETTSFEITP